MASTTTSALSEVQALASQERSNRVALQNEKDQIIRFIERSEREGNCLRDDLAHMHAKLALQNKEIEQLRHLNVTEPELMSECRELIEIRQETASRFMGHLHLLHKYADGISCENENVQKKFDVLKDLEVKIDKKRTEASTLVEKLTRSLEQKKVEVLQFKKHREALEAKNHLGSPTSAEKQITADCARLKTEVDLLVKERRSLAVEIQTVESKQMETIKITSLLGNDLQEFVRFFLDGEMRKRGIMEDRYKADTRQMENDHENMFLAMSSSMDGRRFSLEKKLSELTEQLNVAKAEESFLQQALSEADTDRAARRLQEETYNEKLPSGEKEMEASGKIITESLKAEHRVEEKEILACPISEKKKVECHKRDKLEAKYVASQEVQSANEKTDLKMKLKPGAKQELICDQELQQQRKETPVDLQKQLEIEGAEKAGATHKANENNDVLNKAHVESEKVQIEGLKLGNCPNERADLNSATTSEEEANLKLNQCKATHLQQVLNCCERTLTSDADFHESHSKNPGPKQPKVIPVPFLRRTHSMIKKDKAACCRPNADASVRKPSPENRKSYTKTRPSGTSNHSGVLTKDEDMVKDNIQSMSSKHQTIENIVNPLALQSNPALLKIEFESLSMSPLKRQISRIESERSQGISMSTTTIAGITHDLRYSGNERQMLKHPRIPGLLTPLRSRRLKKKTSNAHLKPKTNVIDIFTEDFFDD